MTRKSVNFPDFRWPDFLASFDLVRKQPNGEELAAALLYPAARASLQSDFLHARSLFFFNLAEGDRQPEITPGQQLLASSAQQLFLKHELWTNPDDVLDEDELKDGFTKLLARRPICVGLTGPFSKKIARFLWARYHSEEYGEELPDAMLNWGLGHLFGEHNRYTGLFAAFEHYFAFRKIDPVNSVLGPPFRSYEGFYENDFERFDQSAYDARAALGYLRIVRRFHRIVIT